MLLAITIDFPSMDSILPVAAWAAVVVGAFLWLHEEITPRKVVSMFESENSLSLRLILAAVVTAFTLCMQSVGRLSTELVEINYVYAGTLLGLGVAKVISKAFAERKPGAQVNAKNATIESQNTTVTQSGPTGHE